MPTSRTSPAGPGAIGDRDGSRRNSWEPWTTDMDNDHNSNESNRHGLSAKPASRRASEFTGLRNAGSVGNGRVTGGSPLARHRLSAVPNLSVPDAQNPGANYSAFRRASQPAFASLPQTDGLNATMSALSLGGEISRSNRASFNAGASQSALRASLATHRPSLPAVHSPLTTHQDSGWNPYYFGSNPNQSNLTTTSTHDTPSSLELSAAAAYGQGYDYRRDSGYGPSPPIIGNSESRRESYASQVASVAGLNNLRRTQSAWHIHDAFATSPQLRHSSFSFMPAQANNMVATTASYGIPTTTYSLASGTNGYAGQLSTSHHPNLMSMDGMFGGAPVLNQHQQLLAEARRQSMTRQPIDFGYGRQYHNANYSMPPVMMSNGMNMRSAAALPAGMVAGVPVVNSTPAPRHQNSVSHKNSFESGGGRVVRSAMLEEFRSNKHRRWELSDMAGLIVEFAGDQLGSRHIQSKLDSATVEEKQLVFDEIYPNVLQLSMDVFANYVVQKFFEQGSQSQKTQLAESLRGHVLQLSLQMYGCRVIQKALEFILIDQQHILIKELEGEVIQCAKDQNANHVLQRSLERIDPQINRFISQAFVGQAFALATHPYGCRVLQRVFEHMPEDQTRPLLEELHRFSNNLMTDQYGNYVAQWIITDGKKEDAAQMLAKVRGQVLLLSKHKFA
ncbi:hypothetical protein O181_097595, partial [Austropuccinia psidii MF-1]|nr:hypothetical protein [Austropuccinia psidii MF-1]